VVLLMGETLLNRHNFIFQRNSWFYVDGSNRHVELEDDVCHAGAFLAEVRKRAEVIPQQLFASMRDVKNRHFTAIFSTYSCMPPVRSACDCSLQELDFVFVRVAPRAGGDVQWRVSMTGVNAPHEAEWGTDVWL
jgi:hypothetical protein